MVDESTGFCTPRICQEGRKEVVGLCRVDGVGFADTFAGCSVGTVDTICMSLGVFWNGMYGRFELRGLSWFARRTIEVDCGGAPLE